MGLEIKKNILYAGYSCDGEIRSAASSGGVVTSILVDLLERDVISGAFVSSFGIENNRISGITKLVSSKQELINFAGSCYIETPVIGAVKRHDFDNSKVAIVTLPCQARAIRKIQAKNSKLENSIILISLFCNGNIKSAFYDNYIEKIGLSPKGLVAIKVIRGYLKGKMLLCYDTGYIKEIPFRAVNSYRQAGFHARLQCLWCTEHFGENVVDISVGDIFTPAYRQKNKKHSAFAAWSDKGKDILTSLQKKGKLQVDYVGWKYYEKYFHKTTTTMKSLTSRIKAAKTLNIKPPKNLKINTEIEYFNLFDYLSWMIYFFNAYFSRTEFGVSVIYKLPKPIIILMAYILKGLRRLKL